MLQAERISILYRIPWVGIYFFSGECRLVYYCFLESFRNKSAVSAFACINYIETKISQRFLSYHQLFDLVSRDFGFSCSSVANHNTSLLCIPYVSSDALRLKGKRTFSPGISRFSVKANNNLNCP